VSRLRSVSCLLIAAFAAAPPLWSQQRPSAAVLLGRVFADDSAKRPVSGAEVLIPSLSLRALTDSLGRFRIVGIAPGRRGLRVNKIGFAPLRSAVEFSTGDTVEMDIGLSVSFEEMAAVEIIEAQNRSRLTEFERRRATGTGDYLTSEDIAHRSRGRLSEAIRSLGGVSLLTSSTGGTYLISGRASSSRTGTCYTAVMLDGVWMYDGDRTQSPFNVNSINPDDVAAIEYYRGLSNTPVELQGQRNSCGALVIWTKY
jgi:Carboxypeptidase regulatory-like domain/TonB-dependent Receptor Plug Domain